MPNTAGSRRKASAVKEAQRRVRKAKYDFDEHARVHRWGASGPMGHTEHVMRQGRNLAFWSRKWGEAERTLEAVTNAKSGEEAWALLEETT